MLQQVKMVLSKLPQPSLLVGKQAFHHEILKTCSIVANVGKLAFICSVSFQPNFQPDLGIQEFLFILNGPNRHPRVSSLLKCGHEVHYWKQLLAMQIASLKAFQHKMVHAELVDCVLEMHSFVLIKSPVHLWLAIHEDNVNSVADFLTQQVRHHVTKYPVNPGAP